MPKKSLVYAIVVLALAVALFPIASTIAPSTSAQPALESVFLVKMVVYTNSDWTVVDLYGLSSFAYNASVVLGEEAPDLRYSSGPGRIFIGKKQYDQTPVSLETWFLTVKGKDDGLVSIEKGHIGDTFVDISYYAGSWIRLASFTHSGVNYDNPTSNTRNFTVDYRPLYSSPYGSATVEPVPSALKKTVLAFYYPWYNNPVGPSGKWFHWEGGFAHEPLFGLYDSKDEGVIEAHIRMAQAAGIDGFVVSWWGVGTSEDEALPIILKVADSLNFSITIYYESYRGAWNLTADEIIDELSYIIRTYSFSQAFLKANGIPVLFVYCVGAWNRSPSFWMDVVRGLEVKVGPVYLVGDTVDYKYADAFDGFHWYANDDINQTSQNFRIYSERMKLGFKGIDWNEAIELIRQGKNLPLKQKFLAFTVHPGFDLTKIGGSLYMDRRGGQTCKEYWRMALSSDPDGVLITSWNEWHEGTEIEPSKEYGFTYIQLTRQYTSLYKGVEQPVASPELIIQLSIKNVVRYVVRNASFSVINDSPSPAICVNLTISLSEGLNLTSVEYKGFYAYINEIHPRTYSVLIPLLRPRETVPFNITLMASVGSRNLNAAAQGYSASGEIAQAHAARQVQVVFDRIIVNLELNTSRVNVGSEVPITTIAHYEYDNQPFVGTVYLNDTLTNNSYGRFVYTVKGISDDLYGLTEFTSNTVSVTFDRITSRQIVNTLTPGAASVNITLLYESDGQPVNGANVKVDGVLATETGPGSFQATVATWSPLYQINVTLERFGFPSQNITLSGYATGNIIVEAALAILVIALIIIFTGKFVKT